MAAGKEITFQDWWELQIHKTDYWACLFKWNQITSEQGMRTKIRDPSTENFFDVHLKATPQELYDAQKKQNGEIYRRGNFRQETEYKKFAKRPVKWLNDGCWMDG